MKMLAVFLKAAWACLSQRGFLLSSRRVSWRFLLLCGLPGLVSAQPRPAPKSTGRAAPPAATWLADNGNGTFTNPLFYDEFSDPDLIRVGNDFYLTGTTMHAMPGLPVLHSKDLVNWEFLSYAAEKLDFGPAYRLEEGQNIYGRGIWAPSFRYARGKYHIFSNVNGQKTQLYTATSPAGPWTHTELKKSFHDLSVLFDDDGKVYVIWGYNEVRMAELTDDLTDTRPGTERVLFAKGSGLGEGSHFYKIDGKYVITSTNYDPVGYMACARASQVGGPYEVAIISADETLGVGKGYQLRGSKDEPFALAPPSPDYVGANTLHQGGLVQTPTGEWWGFSMMDHNSVGRLLCLSPVTWASGWPYFGLPGNLKRSPQTWVKPNVGPAGAASPPRAPFQRGDEFGGPVLNPLWQWNHAPDDAHWSLRERRGYLRLHAQPAADFWQARNSLTQRAIGPESTPTTVLDLAGLRPGDVAGLALLNYPYAWLGVARTAQGLEVQQLDQRTGRTVREPLTAKQIWLRAHCNFDTEQAQFELSTDGRGFRPVGEPVTMVFQLRTFQGVRYALFAYNTLGAAGGYADFDRFTVDQPRARGLSRPIPVGQTIRLTSLADSTVLVNWRGFVRPVPQNSPLAQGAASYFRVLDRGRGRVALESAGGEESGGGLVMVQNLAGMGEVRIGPGGSAEATTFQWEDMLRGDLMLLSLSNHRYLLAPPRAGSLCAADAPGASPTRREGACFRWQVVTGK
ncbi:glycoside hydrolase family 43 protein [Hymenobacter cheonanensis]|uniref:glycoside hydrolase family 43 protein n=1 Tax=Hymenobacter sp. CA2-7 TaxID=3063993 RepID=UPI0027128633|nr:glycoside hydrolase 43 family protein [Hymenobacter sp. CA2-7]MDO7885602.1 glycoside hydrolase 43 family protein [Hymenobacter sp. CA2-7]